MYIWIAMDADKQLCAIKNKCIEENRELGLNTDALSLPLHISLKISFHIDSDRCKRVRAELKRLLSSVPPITLFDPKIELTDNIIWITYRHSPELCQIHAALDSTLLEKFGVPQHEFDKSFIFHSSLFIARDRARLSAMYERIKSTPLPPKITLSEFIIGSSESGLAGTYRVDERF